MTISIDPHRETPRNRWILLQNGEISNREKMIGAKFQSKMLKIILSPGRQDHGARGKWDRRKIEMQNITPLAR